MNAVELGGLGPQDVHDLIEAWNDRERRADMRAGQICSILAEINRDREARLEPFHPADFFASLEVYRPDSPPDEDLEAKIDSVMGRWS